MDNTALRDALLSKHGLNESHVAQNLQNGRYTFGTDSGSANTYAIAVQPSSVSYVAGQGFVFKAANANTGASTLNVNGLGAKSIVKNGATALASGDLSAGQVVAVVYDGTNFQVVGGIGSSGMTNPMTTLGDLLYGGASGTGTRLAGDTSNTRKFLLEQSSGGTAQAPNWNTLQSGDIPVGSSGLEIFGDGSDGTVTISSNTTLAAIKYYDQLTVNSGINLITGNYQIYCRTSATINGTLHCNGNNGANGTTSGGSGASSLGSGVYLGAGQGGSGHQAGGDAGTDIAGGSLGGNGGAGGNGNTGNAGGAGGTANTSTAANGGRSRHPNDIICGFDKPRLRRYKGGAGGGGGGGTTMDQGGPSGGGGGGGAAGVVFLAAKSISGTGTIQANGGNGGNGNTLDKTGGGGGGGGGYVMLIYNSNSITPAASAGSGGTGFGGGTAGAAGSTGTVVTIQN